MCVGANRYWAVTTRGRYVFAWGSPAYPGPQHPRMRTPMPVPADLAETAALVQTTGPRDVSSVADVRDVAGLIAAVDAAIADVGRLDIALAEAGITSYARNYDRLATLRDARGQSDSGVADLSSDPSGR